MQRPGRMMMTMAAAAAAIALLAGCGPRGQAECVGGETLVEQDGTVVVFVNDCGNGTVRTRPATPQDLARLEAPL